jgi:hypothetical protein
VRRAPGPSVAGGITVSDQVEAERTTPVELTVGDASRLRRLNLIIGLVHLFQGVALVALSNDLALPISATFLDNDPVLIAAGGPVAPTSVFSLPIGYAVAVFVFLAAADHLICAGPFRRRYEAMLRLGRNDARWVEYSVSASLMVVLIAGFAGVWDLGAILGIAGVNAAMIGFGAVQERYDRPGREASLLPFWLGTIAGIVPWVIIGVFLLQDAAAVPVFVFILYAVELLFFWSFGMNQWLQYRRIGRWSSYLHGERVYIWLSLGAKSALAWLIFGNVLRS